MSTWNQLKESIKNKLSELEEELKRLLKSKREIEQQIEELRRQADLAEGREKERTFENWRVWVEKAEQNEESRLEVEDDFLLGQMALALLEKDAEAFARTLISSSFAYMVENKLVRAVEQEKKALARELHDGPVQNVAASILRVQLAKQHMKKGSPQAEEELDVAIDLAQRSVKELRELIFNLRPMTLDDLGLFAALRRYVENFQAMNKTNVELHLDQEIKLDKEVKDNVFRILQEAFVNIQKHARATKVLCRLEYDGRYLVGLIQDNGKGFNADKVTLNQSQHFGLIGMQERARLLGGKLNIQSQEGKGTTVSFRIPVMPED